MSHGYHGGHAGDQRLHEEVMTELVVGSARVQLDHALQQVPWLLITCVGFFQLAAALDFLGQDLVSLADPCLAAPRGWEQDVYERAEQAREWLEGELHHRCYPPRASQMVSKALDGQSLS